MANRRVRRTKNFAAYLSAINQDISRVQSNPRISGLSDESISGGSLSSSVVLENNYIQSGNYQAGIAGWKIDSNGVAEFSDIFVRGHIDAQTGSIGYWNISTPVVERTFGSRQLFGTFLESRDLGVSDNTQTEGSYVGLFKSYSEEGVAVTHKYRVNNVATLTAPDHGFQNGDYINVVMEDGDYSFSTGESTVRIFNVTKDNFSYANNGDDFTFVTQEDGEDVYQATFTQGIATLYIKDVAGLYLQDYGRALFDYGYFSNEGVEYVSAETINIIKNPSAEYLDSDGDWVSSRESWSLIGDDAPTGSLTEFNFRTSTDFDSDSVFGARYSWSTAVADEYIAVKADMSKLVSQRYVANDRTLFLNFDFFYKKSSYPSKIISSATLVKRVAVGVADITIVTSTSHGFVAGDVLYMDATLTNVDNNVFYYGSSVPEEFATVISAPTSTSFVIRYKWFYVGNDNISLTVAAQGSANPIIYKYIQPVLDLNDIKIGIDNGTSIDTSTSLFDVVSDVTLAEWNSVRYLSLSRDSYTSNTRLYPLGLSDINNYRNIYTEIQISAAKLYTKYYQISGGLTGTYEDFYICFPNHVLEGTEELSKTWDTPETRSVPRLSSGNKIPATANEQMSIVLDNLSISPVNKFFFGDSGSLDFYYSGYDADDVTDYKYNHASAEAPRQWLNIDLDFQTAQLKYWDSIEFKSVDFKKQVYFNPSIDTVNRSNVFWGDQTSSRINIGDASVLNMTSGAYRYYYADDPIYGDLYRSLESIVSLKTGEKSSYVEINASGTFYDSQGDFATTGGSPAVIKLAINDIDTANVSSPSNSRAKSYISFSSGHSIRSEIVGSTANNAAQISILGGLDVVNSQILMSAKGIEIGGSGSDTFVNSTRFYSTNVYGTTVSTSPRSVYIASNGQFGGVSSSRSTKEDISPISYSVDSLLAVEPVMFKYIGQENNETHVGFIAEQLDELGLSAYLTYDGSGKPVTVNYEFYVSALQKVVQKLSTDIAELKTKVVELENR